MRWMTSTLIALGMACAPTASYANPQAQPQDDEQAQDQSQPQANDPWANNQAPGAQQPAQEPSQQPMDTYEWSAASGPRLGIMVTGLTPELREFYGAPAEHGVLVARVVPGSPAARAGLRVGDVLVAVDRRPISAAEDILGTLSKLDRNQMFPLRIVRDHQTMTIRAQLDAKPQQPAVETSRNC
jgi:membrane-associated protease RseP (regulator of RpoE activity)